MNTCYIAGRMAGLDDHGYSAFEEAKATLEAEGWFVLSPRDGAPSLERIELAIKNSGQSEFRNTTLYKQLMRRDIGMVLQADAVFVLAGWEQSHGARHEVSVANVIGTPVYHYNSRGRVPDFRIKLEAVAA